MKCIINANVCTITILISFYKCSYNNFMSSPLNKWLNNPLNRFNLPICGCYLSSTPSVSMDFYYYSPHTHFLSPALCSLASLRCLILSTNLLTVASDMLHCYKFHQPSGNSIRSMNWCSSPTAESYRLYDFIHHAQMGCCRPYCTIFSHFSFDESLSQGVLLCFDLYSACIHRASAGQSHGFTLEVTNKSPSAESNNLL